MAKKNNLKLIHLSLIPILMASISIPTFASSHREAPFITQNPRVDASDFYMFRSYEANRADYVTLIANYLPLQDSYGGPNYFLLDTFGTYEIKIDNNGDSIEDKTFRFRFKNSNVDKKINGVSIPLIVAGQITDKYSSSSAANIREVYSIDLITRKSKNRSERTSITQAENNSAIFDKPLDNIGNKTLPAYADYAAKHIYNINIPGCNLPGKVFVGQRKDSFVVNLGETFDLINLNPLGSETGSKNSLDDKNLTSIAMEVPITCLTNGKEPVIGAWTTANLPEFRQLNSNLKNPNSSNQVGQQVQVSRLGMPLVNEVVIGLKDKDKFNKSIPANDVRDFGQYVITPTLPKLIETLFQVPAPTFVRTDLVATFVTGLKGLNQPANVKPGEMLRLNTAIGPTALASQQPLGVLTLTDLAGFPNGRRPVDDVVDISLRVAEGILCTQGVKTATSNLGVDTGCGSNVAPNINGSAFTDGARKANTDVSTETFPYLLTPIPGSPNVNPI